MYRFRTQPVRCQSPIAIDLFESFLNPSTSYAIRPVSLERTPSGMFREKEASNWTRKLHLQPRPCRNYIAAPTPAPHINTLAVVWIEVLPKRPFSRKLQSGVALATSKTRLLQPLMSFSIQRPCELNAGMCAGPQVEINICCSKLSCPEEDKLTSTPTEQLSFS